MLSYIIWNANPEIISHPLSIRWYGMMFAIGFLIGYEIESRIYMVASAMISPGRIVPVSYAFFKI